MTPLRDLVEGWSIYDWGPAAKEAVQEMWWDQMPGARIYFRIEEAYRQHQRREAGLE